MSTFEWSVLRLRLVAGGCLSRLVVVKHQLTGLVVSCLVEGQVRMEHIPEILVMEKATSGARTCESMVSAKGAKRTVRSRA